MTRDRGSSAMVLLGLVTVLVFQVMRVLFPLAFELGGRVGFVTAGAFALVVFLAPLLTPVLARVVGAGRSLPLMVGGLVALRLAVQVVHPVPLWLATVATVIALWAWTLGLKAVRSDGAPRGGIAVATLLGLSVDTALRGAFRTWDPVWQPGWIPLAVTAALGAAALLIAPRAAGSTGRARGEPAVGPAWPMALLGPFLMLQLLFLQNVAYVASQAGLSLPAAVAIVLVGSALAVAGAASGPWPRFAAVASGLLFVVAVALLGGVTGPAVTAPVLAAQALGGGLLATALGRDVSRESDRSPVWRASAAAGLASLTFLLFVLLYQIHYEVPLPFPNVVLPPVAATLLALGATRRVVPAHRAMARGLALAALPLVLLVVPLGLLVTGRDVATRPGDGRSFRLATYNVRAAVNADGQLDPEGVARAIEAQRPDVVVVQEVGRGWVIFGTTDLAEWLSRRLAMPYVYSPAADGQFGNAIFTRLPILEREKQFLPFGNGPQRRSYVRVRVDIGGGRGVDVFGVHLQHREGEPTRRLQVEALLQAWGGAAPAVIAGDLNVQPDEEDVAAFFEAGFVSAQDVTGHGALSTAWEPRFAGDRVDWIFGTSDLAFREFAIPRVGGSDHLPLAVTIEAG